MRVVSGAIVAVNSDGTYRVSLSAASHPVTSVPALRGVTLRVGDTVPVDVTDYQAPLIIARGGAS